ncbi:DUF692 domain-containing protein [Myxococcota bacterium]
MTQRDDNHELGRFGIGLRRPHFDQVFDSHRGVDFLEIVTENFMRFGGKPRKVLERAIETFPLVIPHGVGLSIGSPDPLNESYLSELKELLAWLDPPFFSDHLSYSSAFGVEYHDLLPMPFSEEAARHVVGRIEAVQDRIGRRLLLENPSYYIELPGAEMTEAEFMSEVVRRGDCGILLDVNNVYVNSQNHGYDPYDFIDALPLERVGYLHIAGYDDSGEFIVDTHGSHITAPVWDLYRHTLRRLGPTSTLLEWDNNIPPLEVLLNENGVVRAMAERTLGQHSLRRVA